MRLSGWQRIWIVLSIVWALGAGIYTHNADVESAYHFANFTYKTCSHAKAVTHDTDLSSCDLDRLKNLKTWMEVDYGNAAFVALAPIPFVWLAAVILLYVGRAQVIGLRATVPWATLSWPKKAFVAFCALSSLVIVLFGIVAVSNLYADTKVPVSPSSFVDVIKTGDDIVTVAGTWTRTDLTDDTITNPLQTSKIECNKAEHRCTEALASVSGIALMSELVEYNLESWTNASIVFRRDFPCTTEVFTIDLNTNAVNGAGHLINENDPQCKMNEGGKSSWSYKLSNGFKVYWEQRRKARPFILRLIQMPFGN